MTGLIMSQELIIVIALALIFDLLNGMRDASNIVATMISSRAFSPRRALTIAAVAEFLGPFLFGVVVAKTIGDEIVLWHSRQFVSRAHRRNPWSCDCKRRVQRHQDCRLEQGVNCPVCISPYRIYGWFFYDTPHLLFSTWSNTQH